jgi:hypothetical protein
MFVWCHYISLTSKQQLEMQISQLAEAEAKCTSLQSFEQDVVVSAKKLETQAQEHSIRLNDLR